MTDKDLFGDTRAPAPIDDWPPDYREQFWKLYPLRTAKIAAMKALEKAKKSGVAWAKIVAGVERYKAWLAQKGPDCWRPEPKHPATWLNFGCWDDELPPDKPRGGKRSFIEIAMGR